VICRGVFSLGLMMTPRVESHWTFYRWFCLLVSW